MRFALLMITVLFTGSIYAQGNLSLLNSYSTNEGLSHNQVNCLAEDSRGFLWIGTKEGLSRFDGFRFKNFFTEKNNPASLTHNNVKDILEYKPNQLLIATANGLSVLNTLTGKFENEKITWSKLRPGLGNTVHSLYKDNYKNIWVNYNGELDLLDSNLKYMYRFTDFDWARHAKGALIGFEPWQTDKNNRLWFLSDTTGINIIDPAQKKVLNAKNNPQQLPYLQHDFIRSFLVDEENNAIWYAPWGRGIVKYDLLKKTTKQILFGFAEQREARTINAIVKTAEGNILCFIEGKCFELNSQTLQYKELVFPGDPSREMGVTIILKTKDQQYWTGGKGLTLFGKKKQLYQEALLSAQGKSTTGEGTDMFISSSGKLYCTYKNNLLVVLENNRKIFSTYKIQNKPANIFTEVAEDGNQQVWVGSTNGLFLLDEKNRSFSQPASLPADLRHYHINLIFTDPGGDLWIGSRVPFSLFHYTIKDNKFERVDDKVINSFAAFGLNSRISEIQSDRSGRLWMTSRLGGGILSYDKTNNKWQHYPPAGKNYEFLQNKGLIGLNASDSGYLWFSNYLGDGLIRYNYTSDSLDRFSRSDGLPGDYIQDALTDSGGKLWLITGEGISSFNTHTLKAESTISIADVITNGQIAALDQVNHMLALSAPDRILFVPLNAEGSKMRLPVPVIDRITINNKEFFLDSVNQKAHFDHDQKNIAIDFTAVNLFQENIHFTYRLKGLDENWKYAGLARSAQYSVLAPGSYSFIIKSGNDKGEWSQEYELLSFTIDPPWWQTNLFRIAATIFFASLVYLFMKTRIRQIKKEADLKHKIAETEMMALRAQMNPHFIFNCINSIDALILNNDKYKATVYLNKFAKLIRNVLDSSRQNLVLLARDFETLNLYVELELLRSQNKFAFELNADETLLQDDYKVPPLIIQPYVENAILHGLRSRKDNKGRLTVNISRQNGHLKYVVEDNGVGMKKFLGEKEMGKTSYGMQMCSERIKLFNNEEQASLHIEELHINGVPAGTKVTVLLKIV